MTATDDWSLPIDGQEAGLNFSDLGDGVRLFDTRGAWSDGFGTGGPVEKIGYAVHHAVGSLGDGSLGSDLALISAIHAHHTNTNGWAGIGYHRIIGSGRRIYYISSSAMQRAHVLNLNHQWIGWCFLGTWTFQRPDDDRMVAFRRGIQWETDQRQQSMLLAPHKRLVPGTECPGSWAPVHSWQDLVIQPSPPVVPIPDPTPTLPDDFQRGRREVINAVKLVAREQAAERQLLLAQQLARWEQLDAEWGIP